VKGLREESRARSTRAPTCRASTRSSARPYDGYWSRTGAATREHGAWFVNFYDVPASNLIKRERLFVRAVR
jgi:hypothetical protein